MARSSSSIRRCWCSPAGVTRADVEIIVQASTGSTRDVEVAG